jgi:large subunit ribosomal protein L6
MSKIGKNPVAIPTGVTVRVEGRRVSAKGPRGELGIELPDGITGQAEGGVLRIARHDDSRGQRSLHGLCRTLCANMITGVTAGYSRELLIEGTGFKAQIQGQKLMLSLGFASPKEFPIPAGIKVSEKQGVRLLVEGNDKQLVGQVSARIRSFYPAEPYKGKGIRYADEVIRRKQGKKLA